jgi:hypothetical protein
MKLISTIFSPQRRAFRWLALVAVLCVASLAAHAQYRTSVQGVVTDPQGEVVPGATLTLKNTTTNGTIVHTSDANGVFNFNALPADPFILTVARTGFATKVLSDLQFVPEEANALNVQLAVGGDTQTITVDASTQPALNTQNSNLGVTISSNDIAHMPSSGRDVFTLSQLAPGAINDGAQATGGGVYSAPGNQGVGGSGSGGQEPTENKAQTFANGNQNSANGIAIDGISTTSAVWGGASVITPDPDSIGNVRIVTNQYDAENGRFSGALTEITSKSGTNQFHGSLFIDIHRPGLNAYPHFSGTGSDPKTGRDNSRFNQYGGSVGGPIWKNKVFAFFSYETSPQGNAPTTGTGWYDTAAFDALGPNGSIAATYLTFPGAGVNATGLVPGVTCTTAGLVQGVNCNAVAGGLNIGSPLTSALGTQDPTATGTSANPGVGSGLGNVADIAEFATISPHSSYYKSYNGRLDADVTKSDHLSFAIYWVPQGSTGEQGGSRNYDLFFHDQINDAFSVIWNHTFSPTFLNEARANAAGWRYNEIASNPQSPVGLPLDNIDQIGSINLNQFGPSLGGDLNQWTYGYKDVATKVWGQQTIKFGGDYTNLHYLNNPTFTFTPTYNFYNVWDFLNDAPHQEQGQFNPATGFPGGARQDDRENLFGFFVQDDWKIRKNLTINLGMRYSYFGSLYDKQNNIGVATYGPGAATYTGLSVKTGGNVWTPQKGNFGPQFGFNWSPEAFHDKLVVRGGYGLSYNQEEIAITSSGSSNPPLTFKANFAFDSPTNPGATGGAILYGISSSPTNLFGYASNPNTLVSDENAAGIPSAGLANLTVFPSHLPTTYVHHYSLDLQYDLGHQLVATLGYQGSSSHHIIENSNSNAFALANGLALNPLVTSGNYWWNGGSANNNALLAGLKHQFAHHFSAEGQFSWAKSMDNTSGPYEEQPYTPINSSLDYGRSDFNIGKSFKAFGLWQPVLFHGSNRWMEKIAGGWSLSGIYTVHTGFGWTPNYGIPQSLYCSNCGYQNLRPFYLGGSPRSTKNSAFEPNAAGVSSNYPGDLIGVTQTATVNGDAGTPVQYSNQYFSVPNFAAAMTAASGTGFPAVNTALPPPPGIARNSFNGPGYKDVDASLAKAFGLPNMPVLGDKANIEISISALNLFNNLNLDPARIATNINSSSFGTDFNTLGARSVTFHARFSF